MRKIINNAQEKLWISFGRKKRSKAFLLLPLRSLIAQPSPCLCLTRIHGPIFWLFLLFSHGWAWPSLVAPFVLSLGLASQWPILPLPSFSFSPLFFLHLFPHGLGSQISTAQLQPRPSFLLPLLSFMIGHVCYPKTATQSSVLFPKSSLPSSPFLT